MSEQPVRRDVTFSYRGQDLRPAGRRVFSAREQVTISVAGRAETHLVISGILCRYTLTPDGRRQFTALLLPGDLVGFESLLNLRCVDNTIALTSSVCQQVLQSDLTREKWWEAIERQTLAASEWIANVGTRPALARMAFFFHETLTRLQTLGISDGWRCQLPLAQVELADFLALTPVHINRCLATLRRTGVATFRSGRLEVANLQELRRIAQFESELRT